MEIAPKKVGRPATGKDPVIKGRAPKSLLDKVDQWAAGFHQMDRSTALRCLLYLGLSQMKPHTVYDPKGFKAYHGKHKGPGPMPPTTLAERLHLSLLREHGVNVRIRKPDGGGSLSDAIDELLAELNDAPSTATVSRQIESNRT